MIKYILKIAKTCTIFVRKLLRQNFSSELVQLKLNIRESDGDSTPNDLGPTYRGGSLNSIRCYIEKYVQAEKKYC